MTKRFPRVASTAAPNDAFEQSGREEQAHAISLMVIQGQRGDITLFDMLSRFARRPRPAPCEHVELDFAIFARPRQVCDEREPVQWASLLVGAVLRGDAVGMLLVEKMVKRRLAQGR